MLFTRKKKLENKLQQKENVPQDLSQSYNNSNSFVRTKYVRSIAQNLKNSQEIALNSYSRKPKAFLEENFDNFANELEKQLSQYYSLEEIKHLSKVVSQHYAFAKQEKEKYFGNGAWLPFYSQIVLKKELVKEYDGITIKSTPFNRGWTSCTE